MAHDTSSTCPRCRAPISWFGRKDEGTISVELVIVLPMLIWALAASVVFYDGFRNRYHAQMAAQTVADIMSRETDIFTADYVEGLNDVFDFLADSRYETRIRVSSVIWDSANERNLLQWSYGTRGLSGLPAETFELLDAGDYNTLLALFGEDDSFSFAGNANQMPVEDLANRIPPVLPGEALLVVETFALWEPFTNVGVGQMRFTPVVVVRPRFAPWINFDGVDPIYPEDNYEITWTGGGGGNETLPDPNDPDPDPDPDPDSNNISFSFDNGVTTGWSSDAITGGGPSGGFLGPFGRETYDTPVTLDVSFAQAHETATIEFDLLIIDTWDGFDYASAPDHGDTVQIMIDGTPITMEPFHGGRTEFYGNARAASGYLDGSAYRITMTRRSGTLYFAGQAARPDQIWEVSMVIQNPPLDFSLGFSATTQQPVSDEAFGIDNLSITASGSPSQTYFTPAAYARDGTDPITRFPRYAGCPEFQISAPWLSVENDDLSMALQIRREVGGTTNMSTCTQYIRGWGYVSASPSLVVNYDNQGRSGIGNMLRIRMNDGNTGYTCDTTLVIRDPNGQWFFNDDFAGDGFNAGISLGNAPSGQYVIWTGTYSYGRCRSELYFEAY